MGRYVVFYGRPSVGHSRDSSYFNLCFLEAFSRGKMSEKESQFQPPALFSSSVITAESFSLFEML